MAKSMVTRAPCLLCNSSPGRIVPEENIMAKPMVTMAPPKDKNDYSANWKKLQATIGSKKRKRSVDECQPDDKKRKFGESSARGRRGRAMATPSKRRKQNSPDVTTGTSTDKPAKRNEIWFDDVDEILLEDVTKSKDPLLKKNAVTHPTKALAMDCEMVGVGKDGVESALARVSLVNQHGHCIYDKFVRPREKVTDFRTHVSGVRPCDLRDAEDFLVVQKEVSDLLKGRILVGHALHNDLKVLFLDHPRKNTRDTSTYKPFRQLSGGLRPSLKKLSAKVLGVTVQQGEHNSVEDAQAAMRLYMTHRLRWEKELRAHRKGKKAADKKQRKAASRKVQIVGGS